MARAGFCQLRFCCGEGIDDKEEDFAPGIFADLDLVCGFLLLDKSVNPETSE